MDSEAIKAATAAGHNELAMVIQCECIDDLTIDVLNTALEQAIDAIKGDASDEACEFFTAIADSIEDAIYCK